MARIQKLLLAKTRADIHDVMNGGGDKAAESKGRKVKHSVAAPGTGSGKEP